MKQTLFKTILLLMLAASAVPIGLLGYAVIATNRDRLVTGTLELAQERVSRLSVQIASSIGETTRAVEAVVRAPRFASAEVAERRNAIAGLLTQRDEVLALTLFDLEGNKVPGMQAYAAGSLPADEIADHETAAKGLVAKARGVAFSPVRWSKSRNEPLMTLVLPLADPEGKAAGFAAAELSLAPVQALVSRQRFGPRGEVYVVDGEGHAVAHTNAERVRAREDLSAVPVVKELAASRNVLAGGNARVDDFDSPSGRKLAAYAVIPDVLWGVVAEQPRDDAFVVVRQMREQLLYAVVAALLLAAGLAAFFSRRITDPLRTFTRGALEIAHGKFGVQVSVDTKNEINDLAQTFNYMSQQLLAYDAETQGLYKSLEEGYVETIVALANSIDSKDSYTRGHSQRVGEMAAEIGREMKLPQRDIRLLLYGGILHDVGKIGIIEPILCKRSRLTDEEMEVMREHPAIGSTIIEAVSFLKPVLPAVRNHHERWDGTGYPDKLKGKDIPLCARIVNCADTWDACTSTRPYQRAMAPEVALGIIQKLTGTQLDPEVSAALERVVRRKMANGERVSAYDPKLDEKQATG